ncbi:uncharacterized protein LOC129743134, partial [Uranotaenia lowii]|uniref:uncharacterized protein LOC129743134 n=1 Tax=Uranotaenia lowii TaxID=190385 RepID=UPI0024798CA5
FLFFQIKDVTRAIKKAVVAGTLDEVRSKAAEKFGRAELPNIHLDSDGTEVDDEDYFQTLEANAELIVVFPGEQWIDPTHYVTITTRRESGDITDSPEVERIHLKKLVAQMKSNLCNVSVLSEPDLELLSNMDPNSVADITGRDFIEQLKEASGRILHEKRQALDAIELLKLIAKQKAPLPSVVHNIPGGGDPPERDDDDTEEDNSLLLDDRSGSSSLILGSIVGGGGGSPIAPDEVDHKSCGGSAAAAANGPMIGGKQITLELDPQTLVSLQQHLHQQQQQQQQQKQPQPADLGGNASCSADSSTRSDASNI